MRTGLFCTYENPENDFSVAYAQQTELVRLIENLGFEEAWIAEHHFNPNASSPSPLTIIAHLAAVTTRLRLGAAAVLLPFHDPILVAEQVATTDLLAQGRLDLGVAKGGPFPGQFKHFHVRPEDARDKAVEALAIVERLLRGESLSFDGRFFRLEGVSLAPRPVQKPVPIFFATSTPETVALAAERGFSVMAAPPFPLAHIAKTLDLYRQCAPGADPRLVLIRFYHVAETKEAALTQARPWLEPFIERMRATTKAIQPSWSPWMDLERLIEDSLIGSPADIRAKIERIAASLDPRSLVLKPLSPDFETRKENLKLFAETIAPLTAPHAAA
ncbi:MAG: LLM class flavin-dependent oxidoreductase [Methylocystis sp.]